MSDPQKRQSPGGNRGSKSKNNQQSNHSAAQRRLILTALQHGPLTTLESRERLGVMHPAARVQELRERGYPIVTVWTDQPDSTGQLHRVARYLLKATAGQQAGLSG